MRHEMRKLARNIASDTSLIISFRDSCPVHAKKASNIASDIYRCSGEGVMLLAFLFDCIFDGFFDGRNKKRFVASDVTRFLGFLFFFLHRRQLALVI